MARPLDTYDMYRARIFSEDDQLLDVTKDTLPAVVATCKTFFLNFDSVAVVRRALGRVGAYAKAYEAVTPSALPKPPTFVHITLAN